ncbi:hypothetical protein OIU74_027812 [Salix koriyanagi]|uniref:Uncharacterized protein n=1 Tax=Salix koriyanagi TaxID=2511006 RepID=A0A9Q0VQ93_9ROSI|nr:hypothetical protein OIU74_027812 [Salix koriyanagi]
MDGGLVTAKQLPEGDKAEDEAVVKMVGRCGCMVEAVVGGWGRRGRRRVVVRVTGCGCCLVRKRDAEEQRNETLWDADG